MIKIFAKQLIKEGKEEEFLKICAELVEKSRAEEGNVFYSINRSKENDRLFAFIECWKDQAAIEIHNATPHFTTRRRSETEKNILHIRTHRSRISDSGALFCGMPRMTWRPEDSERQIAKRKARPRLLTESDRRCRQP